MKLSVSQHSAHIPPLFPRPLTCSFLSLIRVGNSGEYEYGDGAEMMRR